MTSLPLISIVTVNFNGLQETEALLESLQAITYKSVEIFVVDNGSAESIAPLQSKFPACNFIFSKENLGFAAGNNLAIQASNGKYILLLNNDTEVAPSFLEPLVSLMESNEKIGVVSSKICYYAEKNRLQFAGSSGFNKYTGRAFTIAYQALDNGSYNGNYITEMAHGAAMMVSRNAFATIGLMNEAFFLYYEELDFCERAKAAGFEIWYCGSSLVYHKESMSVGKNSPLKMYYQTRNRLLFTRRNSLGIEKIISLTFFAVVSFPVGVFRLLVGAEWKLLLAFLKGVHWNLFHKAIFQNPALKKPF